MASFPVFLLTIVLSGMSTPSPSPSVPPSPWALPRLKQVVLSLRAHEIGGARGPGDIQVYAVPATKYPVSATLHDLATIASVSEAASSAGGNVETRVYLASVALLSESTNIFNYSNSLL